MSYCSPHLVFFFHSASQVSRVFGTYVFVFAFWFRVNVDCGDGLGVSWEWPTYSVLIVFRLQLMTCV